MKYNRALFISLLLHGLAFAGTNWVISVGNLEGKSACLQPTVCVNVEWRNFYNNPSSQEELSLRGAKRRGNLPERQNCHCEERSDVAISKSGGKGFQALYPHDRRLPRHFGARNDKRETTSHAKATLIPHPDNPIPVYPEQARRRGLKGGMLLTLTINGAGYVVKINIKEGNDIAPLLKEAAFEAVKKWRFTRYDQSTKLLSVTLPVVFNLES